MMSGQHVLRSALTLAIALVATPAPASAGETRAECYQGCLPAGVDRAPDLLLREDDRGDVLVRWTLADPAPPDGADIALYAGNPSLDASIRARGALRFELKNNRRVAFHRFSAAELGAGTFLTVLVQRTGDRERILDWRAWRLSTAAALRLDRSGPPAESSRELDLQPAVLRADTPRGPLPRGRAGDPAVWWSLAGLGKALGDVDLDGAATGLPGIGIRVSSPRVVEAGDSRREDLRAALEKIDGRDIRFQEIAWVDRDEALAPLLERSRRAGVALRRYHAVVTLHTNASVKSVELDRLAAKKSAVSHETSARLEPPSDPRLWTSYNERELGRDAHLLELLRSQLEAEGTAPGLEGVVRSDGDGGPASFHVGFVARAQGWAVPPGASKVRPVIVGLEVVAARAGHGAGAPREPEAPTGTRDASPLLSALAQVIEGGRPLEPAPPPAGYFTYPVTAEPLTPPGSLPLRSAPVSPALQRSQAVAYPPALGPSALISEASTETRLEALISAVEAEAPEAPLEQTPVDGDVYFTLGATLRAGALGKGNPRGGVEELAPIDAYAQYVLELTVAMTPERPRVAGDADASSAKPWSAHHGEAAEVSVGWKGIALAVAALVVGVLAVPGLRSRLVRALRQVFSTGRD